MAEGIKTKNGVSWSWLKGPGLAIALAIAVVVIGTLGGIQMATALRPAVVDFMRLATTSERLDLSAEQVELGPGAPFIGKSLREANLRGDFGVIVVASKREGEQMKFTPSPDDVLTVGDELVLLGGADQLKSLDEVARAGVVR